MEELEDKIEELEERVNELEMELVKLPWYILSALVILWILSKIF